MFHKLYLSHCSTKESSASNINYPSQPNRQDGGSKPTRFTNSIYQTLAQKERSASNIVYPSHPNRQDARSKPTRFTSPFYHTLAQKTGLPATLFAHPNQTNKTIAGKKLARRLGNVKLQQASGNVAT